MRYDGGRSDTSTPPGVAVVGCGAWGRNLVRCFAALDMLRAVVDPHADTAAAIAARFGCRALGLEAALADPAVTACAVATQPAHHHAVASAALDAGKHLFVEKPLTLDLAEAEDLVRRAAAGGRILMAGHILHYHAAFAALGRLLAEGALGRVRRIHASRLGLGAIRRDEDALWCLAPHDVSMALALAGEPPSRVEAFGECLLREDVADAATLRLSFASGATALIQVSWLHPFKEQRLVVIGSDGMAVFDDCAPWERKLVLYPHRASVDGGVPVVVRADPVPVALAPEEPLMAECRHFVDCLRTGREPRTGGREALSVMRVLDRAGRAMPAVANARADALAHS